MRVVVFGATGNVGTSLLERLSARAEVDEVVGVARRLPTLTFPRTRFVAADVERDDLAPLLEGADAAVHLAWRIQPERRSDALERTNVLGSRRVFEAVARSGTPALVYASSVGAYSPGPRAAGAEGGGSSGAGTVHPPPDRGPFGRDGERVDEGYPTGGVRSCLYSRQKARVERMLDRFEREAPEVRVVRMRPGLIFKREAASGIRRLFLGPFLPRVLFAWRLLPLIPGHDRLRAQVVHSLDVGEAFARAVVDDAARGAFNVAAEPVVRAETLARWFRAGVVRTPPGLLRAALGAGYRLRVAPVEPGWLDMARQLPIMRTDRVREVLGWSPEFGADQAVDDLLSGLAEGAHLPSPPLSPQRGRAVRDLLGMPERVASGPDGPG